MSRNYKTYILDFLDQMCPPDGEVWSSDEGNFGEMISAVGALEINQTTIKLFKQAGLDYRRPGAWITLVEFFADVLLNEGTAGRRPKWRRPSEKTLRKDFLSCLNPRLNGEQISKKMQSKFPKKYGEIPASTILRWFGEDGISLKEEKRKVKSRQLAQKVGRNAEEVSA